MYIPVCHTNRQPVQNTIGVVMNRLVGMGLKILHDLNVKSVVIVSFHVFVTLEVERTLTSPL